AGLASRRAAGALTAGRTWADSLGEHPIVGPNRLLDEIYEIIQPVGCRSTARLCGGCHYQTAAGAG
ncbi:MAG TPA: hypothetical protein VGH32_08870, partial [Pirellulales bacterium]